MPSFIAPANYNVGTTPTDVVAADFTRGHRLDLAVANTNSNNVSVLLNNGGALRTAHNYPTGRGPEAIAVGDFNGDGKLDLVTANSDGTVSVLLGNGNGTFQAARNLSVGGQPDCVVVADLNGDGIPDLAVTNDNGVIVLLGNGDGSFQPPQTYAAGSGAGSVAVGDLNGDGIPDLVVVNDVFSSSVSVLLGNGDGTFHAGASHNVQSPTGNRCVVVGDFNHDGKLDFAVSGNSEVAIFLGNGDGTFQAGQTYITSFANGDVVAADLTGNGQLDLALTTAYAVDVLLGNGDGTFQDPVSFPYRVAAGLALGDFRNAGVLGVAVVNQVGDDVSVYQGNGDGTFQTAPPNPQGSDSTATVADLNGDGIPDLIGGSSVGIMGGQATVSLGNGDGTFQPAVNYPVPFAPNSIVVADLNGDGIPDIVATGAARNDQVSVLLGNGDGTFKPAVNYAVDTGPIFVAVADLNGDGIPDLVVADFGTPQLPGTTVSVLLGNGDGSFKPKTDDTVGTSPTAIAVGDINGDGIPDLVVTSLGGGMANVPGGVDELLGNGDGTFQAASHLVQGFSARAVLETDFNGDAIPDLAVVDGQNGMVRLYRGNGDGTFRTGARYAVGSNPLSLALADFNNDGIPDLAVAGTFGVRILTGKANGTFRVSKASYGSGAVAIAVADLNGDGLPDVVTDSALLINAGGRAAPSIPGRHDPSAQPPAVWVPLALARTPATGSRPIAVAAPDRGVLDPASVTTYFLARQAEDQAVPSSDFSPKRSAGPEAAWRLDGTDLAGVLGRDLFAGLPEPQ